MRRMAIVWVFSALGCGGADGGDGSDAPMEPEPGPDAATEPGCGEGIELASGAVRTREGVVQGSTTGSTWSWKGIPFAAPPVGELRLRPPAPATCRTEVLEATEYGPACPQLDDDGLLFGSEDCLALNVWATQDAQAGERPVLVFIHGGGHQQGSTSQLAPDGLVLYEGQRLAERTGAVVVTIEYRLGPLGFLAHPALSAEGPEYGGNFGMLDQLQALRWVQDNIAGFGGDPTRVMVFGESAGAVSVCRLVASPLASGLFAAAGIESGACVARSLAAAEEAGIAVVEAVGCQGEADPASCLRALPVEAIMATISPLDPAALRQGYDGVVDGHALPDRPLALIEAGLHNRVPIIIGSNTEEQGRSVPAITTEEAYVEAVEAFAASLGAPGISAQLLEQYPVADYPSPRAALVAMMTDVKFGCPTREAARKLSAGQDEAVYRYVFSKVPDGATPQAQALGAVHGLELLYVFDRLGDRGGADDEIVVDAMTDGWAALAAQGDPNGSLAVTWPRYQLADEAYLHLGIPLEARSGYRTEQCDFLASLMR